MGKKNKSRIRKVEMLTRVMCDAIGTRLGWLGSWDMEERREEGEKKKKKTPSNFHMKTGDDPVYTSHKHRDTHDVYSL